MRENNSLTHSDIYFWSPLLRKSTVAQKEFPVEVDPLSLLNAAHSLRSNGSVVCLWL